MQLWQLGKDYADFKVTTENKGEQLQATVKIFKKKIHMLKFYFNLLLNA